MKWVKRILIVLLILIICTAGSLTVIHFKVKPELTLKGNKEVVLELNSEYKEEGYKASILGKDFTNKVKETNELDVTKVGTYEIKYKISHKYLKKNNEATRIIKVVDKTQPEIKLTGENVSIYVGDNYTEPGYNASDNYDGDITEKVVVNNSVDNTKAGSYEIIYSVTDSSNNNAEAKRTVEVKEKPIIKLTPTTKYSGYGIPVLMYHFFFDASKGQTGNDSNWMEISAFEEQLKYLVENEYYFPTWQEVADYVDGKIGLPKKSIVITIDDGDASFFELAVPVINKYNVKVTSFIVTSWTHAGIINTYRNDKINFQTHTHDMHKGGCSGGGHGGLFRCIDYNKGLNDLNTSINIIGSSDAIAYPFGDVTENALKITADAGIKLGFTTKYGKVYSGMNKLQLPRIRVNRGISLNGFINTVS